MCGDTIRFAYLPIYMELQPRHPDWLRGVVISVQSVGMLVFIPIMGGLADRFARIGWWWSTCCWESGPTSAS